MKLTMYQVDAFASSTFSGNPAAIIALDSWLDDGLLQDIASENNLSETAYMIAGGDTIDIRWFTPTREVDLCGHATLAAASGAVMADVNPAANNPIPMKPVAHLPSTGSS